MDTLWQDVRYGARVLRKSPGFTAVVVVTLALGIGANAAIFSVVNGVLMTPLPFPEPDRLMGLHQSKPNFPTGAITYPNFRDWQTMNGAFSAIAITRGYGFSLTGTGEAERVSARLVSADFFTVLGGGLALGRNFSVNEDQPGAGPVIIISAGLWQRKFGGVADVLGKSLTLDDKSYTIIGVLAAGFPLFDSDVYSLIGQWNAPPMRNRSAGLGLHGIGRLKPGVTLAQARADLDRVMRNLAAAYPDANQGNGATVVPLDDQLVGGVRLPLLLLLGAVGFVLLIACVNVSNLLLARSTGRMGEFATRAALGANGGRLLRQSLTESDIARPDRRWSRASAGGVGHAGSVGPAANDVAAVPRRRGGFACACLHGCRVADHRCAVGPRAGAEDRARTVCRNVEGRRPRRERRAVSRAGRSRCCRDGAGAGAADRIRPDDPQPQRALEGRAGISSQRTC